MSQGHMLADVVAIIGETLTRLRRSTRLSRVDVLIIVFFLVFFCLATGTQDIVFGEVDR